jgi:hypothetical protein
MMKAANLWDRIDFTSIANGQYRTGNWGLRRNYAPSLDYQPRRLLGFALAK